MNPSSKPISLKFTLKKETKNSYNFIISSKAEKIIFTLEDIKDFPIKIYDLKISFKELKELDDNFFIIRNVERLVHEIKTCIETKKYSIDYNDEENSMIFQVKNEFFEKGVAKIKISEKEQDQDLKDQVKSLTKAFSGLRLKISNQEKTKEELAINSFNGTSFLNNEKKII